MGCLTPFIKKDKEMNCNVSVPCGKCPECTKRRTSGWSFRLIQEERHSECAKFITLTYDTKHVPLTKAGFMSLNKKHVQDFMKRLRKAATKDYKDLTIKYYAVGEYGTDTWRPHYHMLLYNVLDTRLIEKTWDMGAVHYGTVTGASVGYTLKYISKPRRVPVHRNDDREPEFALMSKGLGASYLTQEAIAWHKADLLERMHLNIEGNKKIAMPRYFKDKIYPKNSLGISPERKLIAEHQVPLMDKRLHDALRDNPSHFRDQFELHVQQFAKQAKNAAKQDKI